MKKTLLTLITCLLAASAFNVFAAENKDKPKDKHAVAPLPDVEQAMLTADYWISANSDAENIVMTPEEITAFNKKNRERRVRFSDRFGKKDPLINNYYEKLAIGLYMNPIHPEELPETAPGDSLRTWLSDNTDYLLKDDFYDSRNVTWSDKQKKDLIENMNAGAVPDVIELRFGLVIERADMRLFPTWHAGFGDTKWELDFFQTTAVYSVAPAAILHRSKCGDYYYVQTAYARGWMEAGKIAFTNRKTLQKIAADDNFLMSTEDQVPVYSDAKFENFIRFFYMSEKLPLKKLSDSAVVVKIPVRKANGKLGFKKGYIKPGADVHKGYLPFSKANVYRQAFKLLDTPYGWGDQFRKRDCSGAQRVVLYCFGFEVGRWPNFVLLAPDHISYINPDWSEEEKLRHIEQIEGGITWCGSGGHLVFYLGKAKNGKCYFMHQGGWGYDEGDQHYYVNRVQVNEAHHSWYDINSPRVFSTFRK